jgi:hypothetical protein
MKSAGGYAVELIYGSVELVKNGESKAIANGDFDKDLARGERGKQSTGVRLDTGIGLYEKLRAASPRNATR